MISRMIIMVRETCKASCEAGRRKSSTQFDLFPPGESLTVIVIIITIVTINKVIITILIIVIINLSTIIIIMVIVFTTTIVIIIIIAISISIKMMIHTLQWTTATFASCSSSHLQIYYIYNKQLKTIQCEYSFDGFIQYNDLMKIIIWNV